MRVHQGQLDWDWTSMWSNQIFWMWPDSLNVAGPESFWKATDNDTGTCFLCIYWIFWIQSVRILTFRNLEGGGRNLNFPQGRKPWLLLGMEREEERESGEGEFVGRRGGNGNFYNLINLKKITLCLRLCGCHVEMWKSEDKTQSFSPYIMKSCLGSKGLYLLRHLTCWISFTKIVSKFITVTI